MPRRIKKSKKIPSRATAVVEKIQSRSIATGASKLSLKDINAEIFSTRKKRKPTERLVHQGDAVKALRQIKGNLNWEADLNLMRKNSITSGMSHEDYLKELKKRKPEAYKALKDPEPLACLAWNMLELRGEKGWSQAEMAKRADVAPRMITYIESFSDKANASVKIVQKIAQALDVPFRRLFQEVDMTKSH